MSQNSAGVSRQFQNDKASLDYELAELIKKSSEDMPSLFEQIKSYQQHCSNIKAFIAEVAVKEEC